MWKAVEGRERATVKIKSGDWGEPGLAVLAHVVIGGGLGDQSPVSRRGTFEGSMFVSFYGRWGIGDTMCYLLRVLGC